MKKDDIEVGKDYAASHDNDYRRYGTGVRVRVTGPPERRSGGYGSPTSMVPVHYLEQAGRGNYGMLSPFVPTRQIREPWADYAAQQKAAADAEAKSKRDKASARQLRLEKAALLAGRLSAAGMEDSTAEVTRHYELGDYSGAGLMMTIDLAGNGRLQAPLAAALVGYVEYNKLIVMPCEDALWLAALALGSVEEKP